MHTKLYGRGLYVVAATVIALALAAAASARWDPPGGDAGRSGNQPVGDGTPPVRALYSNADASDRSVVTSVLATTGSAAAERAVYGTANGRLHVRALETGRPVGPATGVALDDGSVDPDVFGPGPATPAPGSVNPVDTSTTAGAGQLIVVHNDDDQSTTGDIAIAQVDVSTGAPVKQVPLQGTNGFAIRSSPVTTAPDATGARVLFFVAENGDDERLFRVPVANAAARSASFGAVTSTSDVGADPHASPALVWLRNAAGQPTAYVAIGSGAPASAVKTFAVQNLVAGPASADLGDAVQTPAIPVQPDGTTPSPAGAVKTAPVIYAAARSGGGTVVHRLVQHGNVQALATGASSPALAGAPAPALATDVEAAPAGPTAGRVVVTTGQNLYLLDGGSLAPAATFSAAPLSPGTNGFGQTTATVANGFAYVTTDDGAQLVLKLSDGKPVAAEDFAENPVNAGGRAPKSAFGQPAVSSSFVAFASQKGVFVYVNRCGNPVTGSEGADRIEGTAAGADVMALGGNDKVSAAGSEDCVFGGAGDDALSGNSGNDRVSAQSGNDRVYGRSGADGVSGNQGNDVVSGGFGDDRVYGREDDDTLSGNSGADTVRGGFGDDRIFGRADADALSGNPGNDRASAGGGNDRVFGRSGDDGVSGNSGDDRVSAGSGDDRAYGRTGDDGVSGNSGNDRVVGGSGGDRLFGRGGSDRIYSRDGERDLVSCGTGRDTVAADREDVLRGCERRFRR